MKPYLLAGVLCFGLLSAPLGAAPPGPPELKKLHVLAVFDTDSNLRVSLGIDSSSLRTLLADNIPPERMTLKVLTDKQVTRENILGYYRDLKVGPDEGLLFFYGGHGGRTSDGKLFFALENQFGANIGRHTSCLWCVE